MNIKISETRKEDDKYFKGPFWVIAKSVQDILTGDYSLLCDKELCTYEGEINRSRPNREKQTHKNTWNRLKSEYKDDIGDLSYNYFPRGRVEVYQGKAYINLNSLLNRPQIIDKIRKEYGIEKLDNYEVYNIDEIQKDSHYDFELK